MAHITFYSEFWPIRAAKSLTFSVSPLFSHAIKFCQWRKVEAVSCCKGFQHSCPITPQTTIAWYVAHYNKLVHSQKWMFIPLIEYTHILWFFSPVLTLSLMFVVHKLLLLLIHVCLFINIIFFLFWLGPAWGLFQLEIKQKWLYVINVNFFVWRHECHKFLLNFWLKQFFFA